MTMDILKSIGAMDDSQIDLMDAGFAFAALDKEGDIPHYKSIMSDFASELAAHFDILCAKENSDNVYVRARALQDIMADKHGFIGDDLYYDDLQNINLFDVIDRKKGLPISLCMIAIALCRAQGWSAEGINFPGHFIMRLDYEGERVMIDPFKGCAIIDARDLRMILKRVMGEYAELSASYYNPCTNREILLRLRNNLKYRLIDAEKYDEALGVVETMAFIAPDDFRIFLDKAVLYARLDQTAAAINAIEVYIDKVVDAHDRQEAIEFLRQLKARLN